jgi:osmotically-inducible protein OsmY
MKCLTKLKTAVLLLTAASVLSGCAVLLVGGAVVGGAVVATDRRSSGTQIDDQAIEFKSGPRIKELLGGRGHVNVVSYNRIVLITGEVPTDADKLALEQRLGQIDNVRSVASELAVMDASSLSERSTDTFITSKVKAALVDAGEVSSAAIKVVTERGSVFLMGRVTEREAARASDVVRTVRGVQKVVRVFETITEDELSNLQPRRYPKSAVSPASAPASTPTF